MDRLKDMLQYSGEMNESYLQTFKNCSPKADAISSMSHIILAVEVWCDRIEGKQGSSPWQDIELEELSPRSQKAYERAINLLDALGPARTINYSNSKGTSFQNSVGDILFHVVNHSTHHRAQIASMLRMQDVTPPPSDYIFYLRN